MAKHTLGSLVIGEDDDLFEESSGDCVATIPHDTRGELYRNVLRAAPELLDACKAALSLLQRIPTPGLWADSAERECESLKAAIANAEPNA